MFTAFTIRLIINNKEWRHCTVEWRRLNSFIHSPMSPHLLIPLPLALPTSMVTHVWRLHSRFRFRAANKHLRLYLYVRNIQMYILRLYSKYYTYSLQTGWLTAFVRGELSLRASVSLHYHHCIALIEHLLRNLLFSRSDLAVELKLNIFKEVVI